VHLLYVSVNAHINTRYFAYNILSIYYLFCTIYSAGLDCHYCMSCIYIYLKVHTMFIFTGHILYLTLEVNNEN